MAEESWKSSRDMSVLSSKLSSLPLEALPPLLRDSLVLDNIQLTLALIEHGVNINTKFEDGSSALHLAVELDRDAALHLLLLHQADSSLQDKDGNAPLHIAAKLDRDFAVRCLLARGADINALNASKQTPLLIASLEDQLDCFEILLRLGAEMDFVDVEGRQVSSSAKGSVQRLVSTRLRMYPHHYLKKTEFTLEKSLRQGGYFYLHYGLFLVALHYIGWVTAFSLFGIGMFFWLRLGLWPGQDERNSVWSCFTLVLYYVNMGVFFAYVQPRVDEVHSTECTVFLIHCVITFLLSQYQIWFVTNPGIIETAPEDDLPKFVQDIKSGRREFNICPSCRIRRPLRSKHAARYDRCITRFDHHCLYVNQTIGELNHRVFVVLLFGCFLHFAHFLRVGLWGFGPIDWSTFSLYEFVYKEPVLLFAVIQNVWGCYFMTKTFYSQITGILTNRTINELVSRRAIRSREDGVEKNPYDLGSPVKNVMEFISPTPSDKWKISFYLPKESDFV